MEKGQVIKSLGYILKKEKLASLATNKDYHELILEDLDPFPGFYDQYFIPKNDQEAKPRSVFVVLRELDLCKEDKFIRITMEIKKEKSFKFDCALAIIQLFNKPTPCLRIFMDDYDLISDLIGYYKEAGLQFQTRKEVKPFYSLIEVRKYFEIEALADNIFVDVEQDDTYYLQVPSYLDWDNFEKVTIFIRNNIEHKIYDAAQAAIYDKSGLVDLVRIYDKKTNLSTLERLRDKYMAEVGR